MTLEILEYPNPKLRERCQEITAVTPEIKQLALDMVETMLKNQGIGLAASQIGELKRIIVVQPVTKRISEERDKNSPQVFINPVIIKHGKETDIGEEGCLSFPNKFFNIKRSKQIELEALNQDGEKIVVKAEGLPARIFQHEIDHLDGILFIDRLGVWDKFKRKFKNLK